MNTIRLESHADSVCLVARDHRHTANGGGKRFLVDNRELVVVLWNHLFVIGIGPFYQPRVHLSAVRPKAEMVAALGDLQFFLTFEEPLNLLKRHRGDDKICTWSIGRPRNDTFPRQAMPVGCNHPHVSIPQLPEYTIENWPALFRGNSKRSVLDQTIQVRTFYTPSLLEVDLR